MTTEEMEMHRAAARKMITVGMDILTVIEVIEREQENE